MKDTQSMVPECNAWPQGKIAIQNSPSWFTCGVWAKHLGRYSLIPYRIFRPNASPLRVMESGIDTWQLTSSKIV